MAACEDGAWRDQLSRIHAGRQLMTAKQGAAQHAGDVIFVVNAGSSSIKFAAFQVHSTGLVLHVRGQTEALGTAPRFVAKSPAGDVLASHTWPTDAPLDHAAAMQHLMDELPGLLGGHTLRAMGHRVVHGGARFSSPVRVNAAVLQELQNLCPLAPLHQPHNLAPIVAVQRSTPLLPQVACFDTAFHRSIAPVAQRYALPRALTASGLRSYGFHGLSYEYLSGAMAELQPALRSRVVALHLGNGASMCALQDGVSVATTMGFTALDGLVMGTRCGSLDPGVVLHLLQQQGMTAQQVQTLLYEQSGLLGVSGISKDMRELQASSSPHAREAIDLFVYRIRTELGAMAAALGGLDGIVFSAGVGENSAMVRQRVCQDAAWLGLQLNSQANAQGGPCISRAGSAVAAWVIPTDEEFMIARHTLALC